MPIQLGLEDIHIGKAYRGKKPRKIKGTDIYDDRLVIWISKDKSKVQYSSASGFNKHYPSTSTDKFLRWVKKEL
jgi:uncharacterized protein YpmB